MKSESNNTLLAVDATANKVLTYNNKIILSVFHSCSGGHTENVEDVWGSKEPYLRAVPDYDLDFNGSNIKECKWVKTFSPVEISARVSGVGTIQDMIATTYSSFGSVKVLKIVGNQGTKVLEGEQVRTALRIKSTKFTVSKGANGSFILTGAGYGHGLGMSQWGAYSLAQKKANYLQILGHYYQGVALTPIQAK